LKIDLQQPIGVIGLGLMGQAFIKRLDTERVPVVGFDINAQRREEIGLERTSASMSDIANRCNTFLLCVFDTNQVREVVLGSDGLLAHSKAKDSKTFICTSTCDPVPLAEIARECEQSGAHFLELPISGTSQQVANADSLGLMGGTDQLCEDLAPLLDIICSRRQHVGVAGDASKAKLAINLVLGLHRAAMAEGLNFAKSIGLDVAKLLPVLQNSAAASQVMKIKGPLMVKRSYDKPQSRVDQSLKDFSLIQKLGAQSSQHLPLTDVYVRLLENCLSHGEGQLDNAIIFEALARNALQEG